MSPAGTPSTLSAFGTLLDPQEAAEPILAKSVADALMDWLNELWAEEELKDVGLTPRKRAIFDGPPGVGKTTLAHHLSARLGLPMLAVRPERIIDCWLGSSSRNMGALFDTVAAQSEPLILFLDEFDALAPKRGRSDSGADDARNEMVNTLLQRIDACNGILIAATNFGENIDPAIWRRFDIQIRLELPGQPERVEILRRYLSPFALSEDELKELASSFAQASPALMRQFCEGVKRTLAIGRKCHWDISKEATVVRMTSSFRPHESLNMPRLWRLGETDPAVKMMHWPPERREASK